MNYFIGCNHYYHDRIRYLCKRPFDSVEAMNQALIAGIKKTVDPKDHLYLLGDVVWPGHEEEFWSQLQGRQITVILGNHCNKKWYQYNKHKYCEVYDYLEIPIGSEKGQIVLFHYPIESWNGQRKGWYHFHSHTHAELSTSIGTRRYHVGVDTIGYQPMTFTQIKEKIEQRNAQTTIA
jgi:calcineurin-like phosphoesterase family protein